MILVFLSPPEPLETSYSNTDLNNMLVVVSTPRHQATFFLKLVINTFTKSTGLNELISKKSMMLPINMGANVGPACKNFWVLQGVLTIHIPRFTTWVDQAKNVGLYLPLINKCE